MRGNVHSVERKERKDWLILQHQYYIKIINSFGEVDENNFSNIRITVLFHHCDDARIVNKASEVEISPERLFPSTNDGENSIVQVTNNRSCLDKLLRRS